MYTLYTLTLSHTRMHYENSWSSGSFFSCMNKCLKSDQTFSVSLNIYKSFHEITYMIWVAYESIPWTSVSQWTNIETICLLGFSIYMYLYYTVIHDYTWLQWGAAVLSWRIPHGHAIPDPAGRTPRPNTNMPKYAIPESILYTAISRSSDFIRVLILKYFKQGIKFLQGNINHICHRAIEWKQESPADSRRESHPTRDKFKEWHDDSMMQK